MIFSLIIAGLKEQYLPIIPEQRIQVQANDVIGWYVFMNNTFSE